ncbi:uncharacterized protein abca12 [Tautogolabrus adspersus]
MNINETLLDHNETLHTMLESANMLKRAFCTVALPMINNETSSPLSFAVVTFCKSNETVFEVSLNTLNQILMQLMLTKPDEMATFAGMSVVLFDQLQNQTSLWETLLVLPQLFSSGSVDQVLDSTETLLTNIQGAMHAIKSKFPEADAPLSVVKPVLLVGLKIIDYAQNWPGKDVSIPLGEIVKLQNDSLSEMMKQVLHEVEIPLDKAIALTMDSDMLHMYVCNNSANPLWLTAACSTGTVHMLLGWIDSDKAAKQVLLAWSKHVAPHDISVAKWLLHSLMEGSIQGEPDSSQIPRTRRSIETQPQNIEEELFLAVGEVILEIIQMVPEVDMLVHSMLRSGFQSMKIATLTVEIVDEIMASVLKDANQLQQTYLTLLTNQSEASLWLDHVVDSVKEMITKTTASKPPTCEEMFVPFEWLFSMQSVTVEVWRSMICGSGSDLEQVLLLVMMPLVESAQDFNSTLTGNANYNVTLPMILSEWQKLNNNSMQFGMLVDRLAAELGGAYWANWMPDNSPYHVTSSLQQSVFLVLVNVGGHIEKSELWHQVKDYFHMVNWVLNYRPDVTTQPPDCSVDISSSTINCNTGTDFNWPQFVTSMTQSLMSPNQDILVNFLKGTVNLLQHVYSDILKSVVGSFLKENIQNGDALSDFLINMVHNLQSFVEKITMLPDENIADSNVMGSLVSNLLQSTGLTHLLPLLHNDGPINVSTVLHVVTKLIRQNQHIFTFNETDPTMPQLERLIKQFLSIEGNLTMSLSNLMGHTVVTYAGYFHPDDVAHFIEAIRPFINQTSPGIVETILRAMELLKTVTEAPNGDPTNIILGYIRQLQDFLMSLFRLRRVQHSLLPNGELSAAQVTDLYLISKDFLKLLTPEGLQGLIDAGPDAAQDIIAQKLIAFLPAEVHQDAALFFQDFKALQHHLAKCAAGQDCLNGISEIFAFLNQILDMVHLADGDVNIKIALSNLFHMDQQYEEIASIMFPLLLSPNDAAYVKTFKQALHFIKLVMATPNITVSDVQKALQQSNLTLEELNNMVSLFGAANINDLMSKVIDVINSQMCFEPQDNQMVTAQCVIGFVNRVSGFLTHLPVLQNETAILSLIPLIVNNTIRDVIHFDFSSNPHTAVTHTLNTTLANIKTGLHLNHLNTPEIMKEIKVLEGLIKLAANPEPFTNIFDSTLTENPMYAQKVYLEIVDWYLKRLENITRHSSLSELLHPIFYLTQMQVTLQLAQTDFTLFVSDQIEHLMNNFQHPIDGAGVSKIGQTAVEMFQRLFKLIKDNLEFQNNLAGFEPFLNTTALHAAELQIRQYLDDIIQKWLNQPEVPLVLASMLQWGNPNITASIPLTDLHHLLQTVAHFLNTEQLGYLSIISNITQSLKNALMVPEQPGGIQSDYFIDAILEAVQSSLQILSATTHLPLPHIEQNILQIVNDSLKLIVQPDMNFDSSRLISIQILKNVENVIEQILPEIAEYLLPGIKVATTYFESSLMASGPDSWNYIILNEMITVQSLLPPNSTAHAYVSTLINITHFLLESGQGNMSLWAMFESASAENVGKIGQTAVEMFHHLFKLMKDNLEFQNILAGFEPFLNTTALHAAELQIRQYLDDIIQKWLNQPEVPLVLASMLQWGNPNITASIPLTDLHHLLQTVAHFLNTEQLGYLSIISNITQSLKNALMVAEQPGGIQSDYFIDAILEAVQSSMQILSATTHLPLPHIEQNILQIVNDSLKLIVQPDMNFGSSRLISIQILKNVENVIEQILPEIAEYLLPGIKVATTYFESSLMASGPDSWNYIILNEMITVQSLLPPNSTAHAYVSTLINITHFLLESGQGNMSLWAMFESASAENLPMIIGKMGKFLGMLWPIIMGGPASHVTAPSLEGFAHLPPILEQVMTGMADQVTWDKLENILEALLSLLQGTELWESVSSVVPLFEKIVGSLVTNMKAENVMILSLQKPMVTLMKEIAHSVNSSHFNLTEVTERMQVAIEHTVQAAQQANSTLECSDVLKAWDPVREAAGLSHATMAMWCNISLQPVLEAYMEALVVYGNLNMSHMNMGAMTVDTTAERIVETLQLVYQVSLNRTHVAQTLIMTFSSHLSMLTGRPLSPEAELHWYNQLQDLQLLNSLSSLKMLTDQLLIVAPSLQPFIESLEKALHHILDNYHQIQDNSSSEDIFKEAVMIFLSNSNITSDDIFSMMLGNFSDIDEAPLTDLMRQAVKHLMKMFEDVPEVYHGLERFLASNDTNLLMQKVAEMVAWLASTEEYGLDMLDEVLTKIFHVFRPLLSALTNMSMDMPAYMGLFEDLSNNIVAMVRQIVSTSGLLGPKTFHHGNFQQDMTGLNHTYGVRRKRDAPWMPVRSPMDDFIDLFYIDYHTMFKALSVHPTTEDIMETVHVFFANPDLGVVIRGVSSDMPWYLNVSREDTIDATMRMLSFFTLPGLFETSSMGLLQNTAEMLPDDFPFTVMLQKISKALASETQENLLLMENTFKTAAELLQIDLTDSRFLEKLDNLTAQVCTVENTETVRMLMLTLGLERGQLCYTLMPALQIVVKSLMMNSTSLSEALFDAVIGDPSTYDVNSNWTSALSKGLNFNASSLNSLNIDIKPLGEATVGEMMRNEAAFVEDVQQHMDFDPASLQLLLNTTLPNNYLMILSWLVNLRHCNSKSSVRLDEADAKLLEMFCSMPVDQWYSFSLLIARHLNVEKLIYRMVLSDEMQGLVGVLLEMAEIVISMMDKILPAVSQLESYIRSIEDFNLKENEEYHEMTRGLRSSISTKATFVTLSRALCSNGIVALFGLSQLPITSDDSSPSSPNDQKREEMIERFKIPRNASPFCMNMYLDMVNTTGGAIAWAFLKPMLMGQILFSPDTPVTRDIMEKSNATLQELADLRKYSVEWIDSSKYIIKSAEVLSHTLPMLQNSLGNSFVKNFIEMQTDINVGKMEETLSNFSNMTLMLEKNKQMLKQLTTMSTLMINLSSCVKFDRYRGYNSVEELDAEAQELAKNRDLYASVIFKLPKDSNSSRKRREASFTSSLPPKVSYTIRMHMDNVMRTDRVRNPYFTKETHINARMTLRYNRGFVYLQENIDRAIIATQTGQTVAEPAVQLQPFPYPCHHRDEYLEAISFVFPLMLMLAWVLFVADFVKKLVHERELRLHEYMKMMGVNPLSHFFAWFLECAGYLVLTIFILTLVLKFGSILPHSDGFLLFLYLCDYGLSILAFSYLVSSFFDKTFIAGLSGSLLYILCFFPFIVVMAVETTLTFTQKSILSLFSPTCFSYASQYISRYESQGEGIHWSNSYSSPIAQDTASFGWLCWLMLIDSLLYFFIGAYIRMVFPGKYGIPAPWYFPFKASFWAELCGCVKSNNKAGRGLLFSNIMQKNQPVFSDDKGKGKSTLHSQAGEDYSDLPVGVVLHGLSKMYGDRVAIENLNVSFYEGHVTTLLGHNGAGKTTTMSLLTGLFAPTSGTIEVYGRDMQNNIDDVRRELGVCMQYDVLFDHMTTKEHLLLYGQIKAPHWSQGELREQVRTILEETGMYAHRHKRVGTLSGGMKRKLSISIAFIGGSRLVVLDEPTTGVDPCSRRSIWDIVIQHKKQRTIIMSTHHLDEAEVLSDRITFLERGGLKCCGSPFHLKDKLGQGYKLTLTKKMQNLESEQIDNVELKSFIQAHVPEARLKEAQGGDLVYSLPAFNSSNASSYRSLLTALDSNLDALQLSGYGISDTTLEEVFLQLGQENRELEAEDCLPSISETVSDTASIDSFSSDLGGSTSSFSDNIKLTGPTMMRGMTLAWQQMAAMLTKRFHHNRRDWKGLICQILLPVLFMVAAMGLGSIRSDLQHYPELELSPSLYKFGPSYSFFSNSNPNSEQLINTMMSFPGIDNACLNKPNNPVCSRSTGLWKSSGNSSKAFSGCKCTRQEQCKCNTSVSAFLCRFVKVTATSPPHKRLPSSQILYNLSGINVENYLVSTANDFIRNRYGGFALGMPLPADLQMDVKSVPKNRTLSKVWFNPEGHHTMPAYLNSINNFILRSNLPADKDPRKYAISVSSHPYFGRADDEDAIVQGMLQILVAMCVLTGYSITTASFAVYVVNEHHSGSKRLQHIAGISEPFYWVVNFFFDMVVYLIPVTLTVGVIAAFQIPAFTDRHNLAAITLLLVLFGFATFPWMYLLSDVFKDAEMAFITYVCINLFISVNTILSTSILYFLSQISTIKAEVILVIFNRLCNAFLIFPQFNFGHGMMKLARKNIEVQILSGYGIDAYQNPFSMDALGWMFISSFIQGVVLFGLRLLLNRFIIRKVRHLICGRKTVPHVAPEDEDEDVATEHLRVASGAASSDILQVNQLTKVYQNFSKKVQAVKRVSVGIPAGECFGLLGVNGAGKTTTFKMLTGDVSPTDGTAQIRDRDGRLVDIMECRNQGINIGYCPQVDALDNLLTGEEHLYFYARIRGISKREIDGVVRYLLKRLELNYHKNITTEGYSCGTRRKLSTALALIGHPQILLLDEPSSGMDPRTKRHLWKIISEEVKGKCAVVLTSHSMEECEALCGRLAIMVKGQFRCLGSLQHIKNRFGSGFTVKMYLAEASCNAEAITGFMQRRFPSTYLKDQHSNMAEYHLPIAPGGVADIFDQLESNKNALQIKHFSVSQTTLDEVFINFAMEKTDMESIPINDEDDVDSDSLGSIKAVES